VSAAEGGRHERREPPAKINHFLCLSLGRPMRSSSASSTSSETRIEEGRASPRTRRWGASAIQGRGAHELGGGEAGEVTGLEP
jgi:hypothetical protein